MLSATFFEATFLDRHLHKNVTTMRTNSDVSQYIKFLYKKDTIIQTQNSHDHPVSKQLHKLQETLHWIDEVAYLV